VTDDLRDGARPTGAAASPATPAFDAFAIGTDMKSALVDVIGRMSRLPPLPRDADRPVVQLGGDGGDSNQQLSFFFVQLLPGTEGPIERQRRFVEDVVKPGLLKLGLITDATGEQFRAWYTHGICHWIGMDVHDVGDYQRPLAAGMAFTVEPGLYIRPQALDELPDTPENRAFKAAVLPAVQKYAQVGIRIEDSFLLTDTGLTSLSATVPRTIDEVEAFMKAR